MKTFFDKMKTVCAVQLVSWHMVSYAEGGKFKGTHKTVRVARNREGSLAEIAGAYSDVCFRRIVPAVILQIAE
jgi:hypothetical protein